MKTPEIRIFYAGLYRKSVSEPLWRQFGWKDSLESDDTLQEYADNYRKAWAQYEADILPALCEVLGLEFYRSVIDVACIPGVAPASEPIIMPFKHFPDKFVDSLTHELCHVLLTDNSVYSIQSSQCEVNLVSRWKSLFGSEYDFNTLVHVPVHALCKYVYLDVLKDPSRLERDIKEVEGNLVYKTAWEYVNSRDYKEIIAQLKQDYADLRDTAAN